MPNIVNSKNVIKANIVNNNNVIKANVMSYRQATTDRAGIIRIATQEEVLQGADNSTAITPLTLKTSGNQKYGVSLAMSLDPDTYILTLSLINTDGEVSDTKTVDFPNESAIVEVRYDSETKTLIFTLESGQEFQVPINGLQDEITIDNKLNSDLVDDNNKNNKFVSIEQKELLDNITSTANEINELHNGTAIQSDFIKLHNITVSATELNYTDGVTNNIQNQLNNKLELNSISIDNNSTNYLSYDNTNGKISAKVSTTITDNDTNLVTGDAVYEAIKDDITLNNLSIADNSSDYLGYDNSNGEFSAKVDTIPTNNSLKLITSNGVYNNSISDVSLKNSTTNTISVTKGDTTSDIKISKVDEAVKSTNDEDGNNIKSTYATKNEVQNDITLVDLSIDSNSTDYLNYDNTNGKFSANVDTIVGSISTNLITSGAVQTGLNKKQDKTTAVTHTENTSVGSITQPIYIANDGVATACNYTLEKSVPSNAVFTDTTYSNLSEFTDDLGSSPIHTHSQYLTEHQDISGKADKATSLSGYGITDAYTKDEIDGKLTSAMHYKGTVANVSALENIQNPAIGDMYNIIETGANYAYNGSNWDKLSENIDLSGCVPTSRTINGKALTGDITLSANDVNALPNSTAIPTKLSDLTDDLGNSPIHTHNQYLTEHQDISGKANISDLSQVATSGDYDDLINKPINVSTFTNDVGYLISSDISGKQDSDTAVTHAKNTAIGDTITPVYVNSSGVATALSYTIAKSVPSDAIFTDTTYSNFVGADSITGGINGLVPAPNIGDKDKFLKGDGTWSGISGVTIEQTYDPTNTNALSGVAVSGALNNLSINVVSDTNGELIIDI